MTTDRRFWRNHLVIPAFAWLAVTALFEFTAIDLTLSDLAYDFAKRRWPHKSEWIYAHLFHTAGKFLILAFAIATFLAWIASWRIERFQPWRRALIYVVICIALSTGVIGALKGMTNRYCPWDMDRYGGKVPYTRLLEGTPAPYTRGKGFPAGHASGAFSLCCLYFVARDRKRSRWLWTLPSIGLGALFAWTQHVRGAHFVSHNLWSIAICWLVAVGCYRLFHGTGGDLDHSSTAKA